MVTVWRPVSNDEEKVFNVLQVETTPGLRVSSLMSLCDETMLSGR